MQSNMETLSGSGNETVEEISSSPISLLSEAMLVTYCTYCTATMLCYTRVRKLNLSIISSFHKNEQS